MLAFLKVFRIVDPWTPGLRIETPALVLVGNVYMELFNLEHALHRSKIFADGQINLVSLRQDISQNLYIYI